MSEIFTVVLPDIGEGVVEGEVIEWLKKVSDPIQQDEPVVIVMTDKATVELPAPYPGILSKQYFNPGEKAIKGKPIYDIKLAEGVQAINQKVNMQEQAISVAEKEKLFYQEESVKRTTNAINTKALATPSVRALAKKLGVDINTIPGTGKEGRVLPDDLKKSCHRNTTSKKRAAPPINFSTPVTLFEGDEIIPLIGIRNLTAEKMVESKYIIPHFSYFDQLDATRLIQLRNNLKPKALAQGIKLTYLPFFIKALSMTLVKFPHVNGSIDLEKNALVVHRHQNIGIAMNSKNGLIVPVLKNCETLTLEEIIIAYENLRSKALTSKLESVSMQDSTITISNFGALDDGGLFATPIINYPEVAILAIAKIKPQPIAKNGEVYVKDVLNLSWSFDHRVIDGDMASSFSHHFCKLVENPAQLL